MQASPSPMWPNAILQFLSPPMRISILATKTIRRPSTLWGNQSVWIKCSYRFSLPQIKLLKLSVSADCVVRTIQIIILLSSLIRRTRYPERFKLPTWIHKAIHGSQSLARMKRTLGSRTFSQHTKFGESSSARSDGAGHFYFFKLYYSKRNLDGRSSRFENSGHVLLDRTEAGMRMQF